ncbi:MAG: hypothetical protein GXX01_06010 [Clostridiales bacterium]|nr:hypothetical protein [Clostridiales bacterium]
MAYWNDGGSANKILVIGDIMLDEYVIGRAKRLCSEAPVPIIEEAETYYFPGGAANVAANIKGMGGQVILAGVIGKDEEGEFLRKILSRLDIPTVLGVDSGRPTIVKKRIGTRDQLIVRVDREVAKEISQGIFHDIIRVVALLLEDVKLVAVSDYDKGVVTEKLISVVSEICRSRNIPVFVNPSGTEYGKYREADLLVPNFRSLEILYGKEICDFDEMQKAAGLIFSASACKACIITWGCNGAVLFRNDKEWIHYPRRNEKRSAFISGAGDVFLAALAMATVQGASLEVSCMAANETVSAVEGRIGTMAADAATWKEVIKYIYKKEAKVTPG